MRLALISLLMIPLIVGCETKDDAVSSEQWDEQPVYDCRSPDTEQDNLFNCEEDITLLYVGTDEVWTGETCDGVDTIPLRSSSCSLPDDPNGNEIGQVSIDRCGGPVGTEHQIVIRVNNLYIDNINRASVRISSDDHDDQVCMMTQDSAHRGLYKLTLTSEGTGDEVRNDTLQFRLWKSD